MPLAIDPDRHRFLRCLPRVIETFFCAWLNTWNGPNKSIPELKRITTSLWTEICPNFDAGQLDYVGLTSHTPLQETTTEFPRATLKHNLQAMSVEFVSAAEALSNITEYHDDAAERLEAQIKRTAREEPRRLQYNNIGPLTKARILEGRRVDWNMRSDVIKYLLV